eukprot:2635782-Ditylum_brightwellii.AAC.1
MVSDNGKYIQPWALTGSSSGIGLTSQASIITSDGFDSLESFGLLEGHSDITKMVKRLAGRPAENGRVLLGTGVKDRCKRGQPLVAADFNAAANVAASADKAVWKELKTKVAPYISKLGKFDPDLYDAYEDSFTNLLGDCIGVQGISLRYVIRDGAPPTTFLTTEQERMFQIPLIGNA